MIVSADNYRNIIRSILCAALWLHVWLTCPSKNSTSVNVWLTNLLLTLNYTVSVLIYERVTKKTSLLAVFACLGFLSPANRGALMTCAVVLWVLLGTPAGYVAARLYKCEWGREWGEKQNCIVIIQYSLVYSHNHIENLNMLCCKEIRAEFENYSLHHKIC